MLSLAPLSSLKDASSVRVEVSPRRSSLASAMSTLSISPFSASPLHAFHLPKSSSGRSNCGDADWTSGFHASNSFNMHDEQQKREEEAEEARQQQQTQQSHRPQQQPHHAQYSGFTVTSGSAEHGLDGITRSISFPPLAASPSLFSPLDAQSSSPSLISPKLFSPLDSLSPPRIFPSSSRLHDLTSPSHMSPTPLFAGGLSVSPRQGGHHSSLTASLSARQHADIFGNGDTSSTSQSCPADSLVPSATNASAAPSPPQTQQQEDGDVGMAVGAPAAASSPLRPASSHQQQPQASSALSDMSNDHYLSFEVLNIDALTGHIKTEETAFSPANAAVFDFVSLQQPLQDALAATNGSGSASVSHSSAASPASATTTSEQPDYAYHALNFDDADSELLSRASSPASQMEAEDALDRITSPQDSAFFLSQNQHNSFNFGHSHNHPAAVDHTQHMASPFTLPPTTAHRARSHSSRASRRTLSRHSHSQSTPSTPQYSPTGAQPSLQLQSDLNLLQSSVSHMDYQQRVKFVESFKALADKGEPAVAASVDGEASGMDPNVLNMIFSPADAHGLHGLEQRGDEEDELESDMDEDMGEGEHDMQLHAGYAGERLTGRRRKRLQVPHSPNRRFSVPALRTSHPGSVVAAYPFPPLSPSLSVSSHNSSGSSPLPRSFASGSDEDSLHGSSPHPRMAAAVVPVSVMAQQITPVQAVRCVGASASGASASSNVTTATAVVEEVMNALPVSPSSVVTAEAVTAVTANTTPASTPTAAAAMAVAVSATAVKSKPSSGKAVSSAVMLDGVVPAAVVPASSMHSSAAAAVPATLASAASPIQRARVVGGPRQAFAFPLSKKHKSGKALPAQQLYGSPVAACIPATTVSATVAYAQPMHAAAVATAAVEAKGWKAMK